jgi:nicotinate-nucleotide adenylyltransferase
LLGVIGGTFNPIHYGHLLISEAIREEFALEKILFVPAQIPPHKDINRVAEAEHRLEMARLATKDNPFFEVSDIEMKREGASYTVDTLLGFKALFGPETQLSLIVGADAIVQLTTWRRFEEIIRLCRFIVARRPDIDDDVLDKTIDHLVGGYGAVIKKSKAVAMPYSSTEIRERVSKGLSIRYRVPPCVEDYIQEHRLYR